MAIGIAARHTVGAGVGRFGGSTTVRPAVNMDGAAPWRTLSLTWGKDSD